MRRVILAITGASGVVFGIKILEKLAARKDVETHLCISPSGEKTIGIETDHTLKSLINLADVFYKWDDIGAAIASGSYPVYGMLIAPCSIKTLSAVANSYADNLIVRAADVQLKQGRPLLLMVRETPLHRGHLRLMDQAAKAGAVIMPPVPAFYAQPDSIDSMVNHTASTALRTLGLEDPDSFQWKGN